LKKTKSFLYNSLGHVVVGGLVVAQVVVGAGVGAGVGAQVVVGAGVGAGVGARLVVGAGVGPAGAFFKLFQLNRKSHHSHLQKTY
jgi:hypothetical protein